MKNISIIIAAIILTAIGSSLLTIKYYEKKDNSNSKTKVNVGLKWLNQAQFAGFYVAKEKGVYSKKNIEVNLIEKDSTAPPVLDQVIDGKMDFGIISTAQFLKAIDKKKDIVAIAAFFQYSPTEIISLEDKKIYTPADLQGKTIGLVTENEESKFLLISLLTKAGVPPKSINYKSVGIDRTKALTDGEVDAVALYRTSDVYEFDQTKVRYNSILPERYGIDTYNDILITSKSYLETNPEVVKSLVNASKEGWALASKNQSEAVSIILKYDNPKYHDQAKEEYIFNKTLKLIMPSSAEDIGKMTPTQWDYTYELFFNQGLIGSYDIHHNIVPQHFFK